MTDSDKGIVVCVEIGTSRSGVAYALRDNPSEIYMGKDWPFESGHVKMRSSILMDHSGKLMALGQQAVQEYLEYESDQREFQFVDKDDSFAEPHNVSDKGTAKTDGIRDEGIAQAQGDQINETKTNSLAPLFFRNFKMALYGDSVTKEPILRSYTTDDTASSSSEMGVKQIFGQVFVFFKKYIENELARAKHVFSGDQITWVITVPSIWSEGAKQLMRETARDAGLCGETSGPIIALEPEVVAQRIMAKESHLVGDGDTFLVCDCGGGTVDVTVHERTKDNLREVTCHSGVRMGSMCIDENFEILLCNVLGAAVVHHYKTKFPREWEDTLLNFETVKMTQDHLKETVARKIHMPQFSAVYERFHGTSLHLLNGKTKGLVFSSRDDLCLSTTIVQSLFNPVIDKIVSHVNNILKAAPKCHYIFLTGGFAESELLKSRFDEAFGSTLAIVRPPNGSLAVLTGGVMFGLAPTVISKRIAKFGYGICSHAPFDENKHSPARKVMLKDGRVRCEKLISYHISPGQEIGHEERYQRCYGPLYSNQETVELRIIQTSDKDAIYSDEKSCVCLGILTLDMDLDDDDRDKLTRRARRVLGSKPSDRDIMVSIGQVDSMIRVEAIDVVSGQVVKSQFNVLHETSDTIAPVTTK